MCGNLLDLQEFFGLITSHKILYYFNSSKTSINAYLIHMGSAVKRDAALL